jgi:protein TonB
LAHLLAVGGFLVVAAAGPRAPAFVEVSLVAPPRETLLPAAVSGGAGNRSPHAASARPAPRPATDPGRAQGRLQGRALPASGLPAQISPAAAPVQSPAPPLTAPSRPTTSGAAAHPALPSVAGGIPGGIGIPDGGVRLSGPAPTGSASGAGREGAGFASPGYAGRSGSGVSGSGALSGDGTGHVPPAPRALRDRIQSRVAYPAESIRREEEGEVLLRVLVGREGDPREIRVVRSSGVRRLDEAARRGVGGAAPLPSSPGWYEVPVRFSLRID